MVPKPTEFGQGLFHANPEKVRREVGKCLIFMDFLISSQTEAGLGRPL